MQNKLFKNLFFSIIFLIGGLYAGNGEAFGSDTKDRTAQTAELETPSYTLKRAEFKGGKQALAEFLKNNLMYPLEAEKANIQGRVFVSFIIKKNGSIGDIEVIRGVHPLLDAEAIRVIKIMPKWEPATENGEKIDSKFTLPVSFLLK